ncbi:unnamed protein product [Gongylonema pulchrum]|uniref:Transmembrane protein n=1 Tax=Gongylonema pulchrum TaxID=637853 RepID=A0A183E0V2_9BILA|nr:unnamed protein product [Gongylonema pulchrum]
MGHWYMKRINAHSGVNNFIDDVGEMLRVPTSLQEVLQSQNLSVKQVTAWSKLKFFFGPTGDYIRWTWSLCSPCILLFLMIASLFSYERVTLEDYPLPLRYELVAWLTMVGPLLPLLSVFDCSRWRHKHVGGGDTLEPKHATNEDHDYWSIADPISRVASARRPNASLVDEVGYGTIVQMINEWAKKNAAMLGDRYIGDSDGETCQSTSFGKPPPCVLPCTEQGLHLRQTMDCQSESSISITPTGSVQSYSSGFMVNNGTTGSSSANDRHQLPVLRRPGPVKTPPPFNQL